MSNVVNYVFVQSFIKLSAADQRFTSYRIYVNKNNDDAENNTTVVFAKEGGGL